jgi:hypothetical protein
LPRLLVLYHFFHPDDVISARHFGDFAEEQHRRGWDVTVVTSNRSCRDPARTFPAREDWRGVRIIRVFRPALDQARALGRLGNSGWLITGWSLRALIEAAGAARPDVVVIGSDPAFALAAAIPLRAAFPRLPIVHWCFDLYPEAIEAEGAGGPFARVLLPAVRALMGQAYRCCDEIVDLGPCMRARLARYDTPAHRSTLVPWALAEPAAIAPPDPAVRAQLFPRARLALLYAGTMGRAHDFELFLRLARACRARSGDAISFCFACRGNRMDELRRAVGPDDSNVSFAPFADESALQARLEAADLHLLSLRADWAGIVVPSKFFGSLAVGRPVIYAGPAGSAIAAWIREHGVGLHLQDTLDEAGVPALCERLHDIVDRGDDGAAQLAAWQARAKQTYDREFSKRVINDRWDALLRTHLVGAAALP